MDKTLLPKDCTDLKVEGMRTMRMEEARAKFGDLVDRARLAGETTVITRYGKPVAAIVPYTENDTTAPAGAAIVQPEGQDDR